MALRKECRLREPRDEKAGLPFPVCCQICAAPLLSPDERNGWRKMISKGVWRRQIRLRSFYFSSLRVWRTLGFQKFRGQDFSVPILTGANSRLPFCPFFVYV